MKKIILFIVVLLVIGTTGYSKTDTLNRFYSSQYLCRIDLPKGFNVQQILEKVYFVSSFSKTKLSFFVHENYAMIFNQLKNGNQGKLLKYKTEVEFSNCRQLLASKGGYLIFKNKGMLTHYLILKKEYRVYVFETKIRNSDLIKFKKFISSIRLLMPDELTYEYKKGMVIHRLVLVSDKTFRYSIFKGGKINVYIGLYEFDALNSLKLKSLYFVNKISVNDGSRIKSSKIFKMYKYNDNGEIKSGNLIFKKVRMIF